MSVVDVVFFLRVPLVNGQNKMQETETVSSRVQITARCVLSTPLVIIAHEACNFKSSCQEGGMPAFQDMAADGDCTLSYTLYN